MTKNHESIHRGLCNVTLPCAVLFALLLATMIPSAYAITPATTSIISGTVQTKKGVASSSSSSSSNSETSDDVIADGKRRGKVLQEPFDEHDLLQAYEEIKLEYHQKAFGGSCSFGEGKLPADQQSWRLLTTMNPNKKKNNKNDDEIIQVSMLEHPSDPLCPYVRMETVIPMSVEKCWDFLSLDKWDETMPKMDPFYEGLDIYGEYSVPMNETEGSNSEDCNDGNNPAVKMILARKRTKRILTFGKREFVFVSVEDIPLQDGTWVSGTVSVEVPEGEEETAAEKDASLPSLRRTKSYTRAFQDSIAFYKPLPATEQAPNGRTRVTIVCRIDLNDSSGSSGGCIPMWLYVKTIGITGARSVMSMRKCLLEGDCGSD